MKHEKISIGILNHNGINRLEKILPSILSQNYENKEILVVDNGSDDGSIEYLKNIGNIKIIENGKNLGYGKAKNILVKECSGKYILMLDNDIELPEENFLENMYKDYIKQDKKSFMSALIKDYDKDYLDSIGLFHNKLQKRKKIEEALNRGIIEVGGYHGSEVFFEKEIFEKLGGFDEIYPFNIDDYDLSARASLHSYKSLINTNFYVIHRGIETRVNIKPLCWKNQYYLCGFSRTIWKNYKITNITLRWPVTIAWIFVKSCKIAIKGKSFCPIVSYFKSTWFFIRDFGETLKKRKKIQKSRTEKEDLFLKVKYQ